MMPLRRTLLSAIAAAITLPATRLRARAAALAVPAVPPATPPMGSSIATPPLSPPPIVLPTLYGAHIDPALCLVSEKYDGVRAFWDGRVLRHRSGRTVAAPAWFIERLPRQPLDGELWLARGRFDELSGIVRKTTADDAAWRRVRYLVFELPAASGNFAERAERIAALVRQSGWAQLEAVEQTRVAGREALRRRLAQVVAHGGEGLVLHLASAPYLTGRSDAVTKLKPQLDTEAVVVGHRLGKGKYAGELGALQLQTPQGRRFFIGSGLSDALRRNPPALGSLVTYRYRDLTPGGVPRFASFLRVAEPL